MNEKAGATGLRKLVASFGIVRVVLAVAAIPVAFTLGFKSWLGDLGFLMLQPGPLFTLSADFGQVVLWVLMLRIAVLLVVDGIRLFWGKVRATLLRKEVRPYEEPLSETEELVVNTVATIAFVLLVYSPSVAIYFFIGLIGWVLAGKNKGAGVVDPSSVGMNPKASEWNRKMVVLSALAVVFGGAFSIGYGRAQKLLAEWKLALQFAMSKYPWSSSSKFPMAPSSTTQVSKSQSSSLDQKFKAYSLGKSLKQTKRLKLSRIEIIAGPSHWVEPALGWVHRMDTFCPHSLSARTPGLCSRSGRLL